MIYKKFKKTKKVKSFFCRSLSFFLGFILILGIFIQEFPANQVKASTPPITNGLVLHLDADAIEGLDDDDPLSTWEDLSGEGNNATSSGSARPTFKTNILNGRSVVRFDGSGTYMQTPDLSITQPNTIFVVWQTISSGTQVLLDTVSGPRQVVFQGTGNADNVAYNAGSTRSYSKTRPFDWFITGVVFDGSNSEIWDNGVSEDSGNVGNNNPGEVLIGCRQGQSFFLDGDIAEILIYDGALSDLQRKSVETYLHNKWLTPSATWREAENQPTEITLNRTVRLRIQVDNQGNVSDTASFQLDYAKSTLGPWIKVPVDLTCESMTEAFRICESDFVIDGGATTRRLSNISGSTFIPGFLLDVSNPANTINFQVDQYSELEWAIQATNSASPLETYYFRLSNSDGSIGTYTEYPEIGITAEGVVFTQKDYRWYEHNDQITPTQPWNYLGENTAITLADNPPGAGDILRLRVSIEASNETLPVDSRSFRLQYGERETNCTSINSWSDVGLIGSSSIWRGTSTAIISGTELSQTLLLNSDVTGTFEEENPSALNPNYVSEDDLIEYDWVVQNNSADAETSYCFRMVEDAGQVFDGGYDNYPILTTKGFTPESGVWRWFSDVENVTPEEPLSPENSSPIDVNYDDSIKLRVVVDDVADISGENVKFRLQFSESSSFSSGGIFVEEIESCEEGESIWCYAEGGGDDNAVIPETLLSTADSCVGGLGDGCGTHNFSGTSTSNFSHPASASTEYEFTIRHAGARANTVYFFRLVREDFNVPVPFSEGGSYPSLSTLGATLSFSISGVGSSVSTEGITTDVATTPTSIPFGSLPFDQRVNVAQRKTIETNAPNGFTLYMFERGPLMSSSGRSFEPIIGTNNNPLSWSDGCSEVMDSCYGYHSGDDILRNGSIRFAPDDSYAAFEEIPREIAHSSSPVSSFSVDTVFSIKVSRLQPAGNYRTGIVYILVPSF